MYRISVLDKKGWTYLAEAGGFHTALCAEVWMGIFESSMGKSIGDWYVYQENTGIAEMPKTLFGINGSHDDIFKEDA